MALICHDQVPQPGISRHCERGSHLSFPFKAPRDFPHRCLPFCWRRRFQDLRFPRPRAICILAHSSSVAPTVMPWNLSEASGERTDLKRPARLWALHLVIRTQRPESVRFKRGGVPATVHHARTVSTDPGSRPCANDGLPGGFSSCRSGRQGPSKNLAIAPWGTEPCLLAAPYGGNFPHGGCRCRRSSP